MSHNPSDSAIRITPAIEQELASANSEQIKEIMARAAIDQNLAVRDIYSPDILLPTSLASAAPRKFAKSITVDGQKRIFEADSELELERSIGDYFRSLQAAQETNPARQQQQTEQPRNERGQFRTQEEADAANQLEICRRSDLEMRFRRGEIDPTTYLEQSGAVADYLAKQGVPLEELKAQVAENQTARFNQSWTDATNEFLARHPEWEGGEGNRNLLGQILVDNNLVDAEDKVEALEAAYNHARENNLLGENPNTTYVRELSEARSAEEITAVNQKFFGGSSSGLFNR